MSRIRFRRVSDYSVCETYAGFNEGLPERALFPHAFYAGYLNQEDFVAQIRWLRLNGAGTMAHNYIPWRTREHCFDDFPWHTVFAFDDANTAMLYKLRWSHPKMHTGPM